MDDPTDSKICRVSSFSAKGYSAGVNGEEGEFGRPGRLQE